MGEDLFHLRKVVREKVTAIIREGKKEGLKRDPDLT
jgi:hypothetical protein